MSVDYANVVVDIGYGTFAFGQSFERFHKTLFFEQRNLPMENKKQKPTEGPSSPKYCNKGNIRIFHKISSFTMLWKGLEVLIWGILPDCFL